MVKITGYIEMPHTKAKNIACGFNRKRQRIFVTIIRFTELTFKTHLPWLKPRAILNTTQKAKTIACGLNIGRQYK